MHADALHLLRRLEPPVRPSGGKAVGATAFERMDFGSMLSLVSRGGVRSERSVEAPALQPEGGEPLDDEQLARLATAADLAEANGAARALMVIDGRTLVMNVPERRVEEELGADSPARLVQLDVAVYVANPDDETAPPLGPPGSGLIPPFVERSRAG